MPDYTIDEGYNPATGIRTRVHFEDGQIVHQKTYDAQPYLDYAKQAREATEGKRWGDGKLIGTIPPAEYAAIQAIRDPKEREAAVMRFFRERQAFVMYERALK